MSSSTAGETADHPSAPVVKRRRPFAFSLKALFVVTALVCFYQAYRTNRQVAKYYTPAPVAAYSPDIATYEFTEHDFVYPIDPRPATVQLREQVEAISKRIAELRARGEGDLAAAMQAKLDQILANRGGPYPLDGTAQVHAIGLYDGGDPKDKVNKIDRHEVGDSHVKVTYADAPIILVLCAYDPVRWIVDVAPAVQLKKVILAGNHRQQVQGIDESVPIEGHLKEKADTAYRFYACRPVDVPRASAQIQTLTGLAPTTFLVTHEYEGKPFVIGPDDSEWSAKMTVLAVAPLYREAIHEGRARLASELVRISFPEIAYAPQGQYGDYQANFATHSIFGPYATTMQPLEQSASQFAIDPNGPSFFARRQGIVTIDPESGSLTPMNIRGLDDRAHSGVMTFDSTRHRLVLWGRDLVAIDILKKETLHVRGGNPDVVALVYSKDDDRLYAACAPYDGNSHSEVSQLRTFNHRGAELGRTKLTVPIPNGKLHMVMLSGKLVMMTVGTRDGNGYFIPSDINYVVDPKTGDLLFACKREPR